MAKIFLSYRRQDSAGEAGRKLHTVFALTSARIPFSSTSIPFRWAWISRNTSSRFSAIAASSSRRDWTTYWAGQINTGRRIDDPRDWVRIEVEVALKRGLPVIPVLIDHTRMPSEANLPPSLARLARRNALSVDQGRDFHVQVDRLIRGIELLSASDLVQGPKAKPQALQLQVKGRTDPPT